ncbi:MAG: c-type cytochrome, partial [Flavobacteriales bacterium]|nr:c-type cytochrome [Flavobacteriales bacterium]
MLPGIIVLLATLLVLVVQYQIEDAFKVLKVHGGLPVHMDLRWSKRAAWLLLIVTGLMMIVPSGVFTPGSSDPALLPQLATFSDDGSWTGPDTSRLALLEDGSEERIRYGRELIARTSAYLGPKGSVAKLSNGMNCQNCHLDAGTKPWGNNFGAVWSTYPKERSRSGKVESIERRVNDCLERSLNGRPLDSTSREMRAIVAYMEWLGTGIERSKKPPGTGIMEIAYLDRAADPELGRVVFEAKCSSCHNEDGQGKLDMEGTTYLYPPMWGEHSYNHGAGLYRLSRFAGYVKANMPQGSTHEHPLLTDEEAWDVAAFVNSQPRPEKDLTDDWPDIS